MKEFNALEGLVSPEEMKEIEIKVERQNKLTSQIHDLVRDMTYSEARSVLYNALNRLDEIAVIPPAS